MFRRLAVFSLALSSAFVSSCLLDRSGVDLGDDGRDGGTDAPTDGCVASAEVCDGLDNDCDPTTADGAVEVGTACDDSDLDHCEEGTLACVAGALVCNGDDGNQSDEVELCDGADNDCNSATVDGASESWLGDACDDGDADDCDDGAFVCSGGSMFCNDDGDQPDEVELCDGSDNDCDPSTLDGSADTRVGGACDDPSDTDLCADGQRECVSGSLRCTDDGNQADEIEICDGNDNDCNGATADGAAESWFGDACDDPGDADACIEGTFACESGGQLCNDDGDQSDEVEVCDGIDNDCRPATLDGAAEPTLGQSCDDPGDADRCADGVRACVGTSMVCNDDGDQSDEIETCDGKDNDCNGATADGAAETWIGDACDAASDTDLCQDGVLSCVDSTQTCNDDGNQDDEIERCDGADNDCNEATPDGAAEGIGAACDATSDADSCPDGVVVCTMTGLMCSDDGDQPDEVEACDGLDNDCNDATADGAAEIWFGGPCDDGDADQCAEGTFDCVTATMSCTGDDGNQPGEVEICDGLDNDCSDGTPDGAAVNGDPCDGADADLCEDDVVGCSSGTPTCSTGANNEEVCDGNDNDCDLSTSDGSSQIGVACDGPDGDQCAEGTITDCVGGTPVCSDPAGEDDVESCNAIDDDCDGTIDEGAGCPFQHRTFGGHTYLFVSTMTGSQDGAFANCSIYGYQLVRIDDATEQAFVASEALLLSSIDPWWIGATDRATENTFVWYDGSAVTFSAWQSGEPDDDPTLGGADCATLVPTAMSVAGDPGGWDDLNCGASLRFVCEAGP